MENVYVNQTKMVGEVHVYRNGDWNFARCSAVVNKPLLCLKCGILQDIGALVTLSKGGYVCKICRPFHDSHEKGPFVEGCSRCDFLQSSGYRYWMAQPSPQPSLQPPPQPYVWEGSLKDVLSAVMSGDVNRRVRIIVEPLDL